MFQISCKGLYASQALLELAKNLGQGPMQIREISGKCNIPKNYLEQLFHQLKNLGIIKSLRGSKGGYILASDPKELTLLHVLESLEGNVSITGQVETNGALQEMFEKAESCVSESLNKTFAELVEKEKQNNLTFYI